MSNGTSPGKRVTGFANGKEAAVRLTNVVPFRAEDARKRLGASTRRQRTGKASPSLMEDSFTGQNPASSKAAAEALLALLA